MINGKLKKQVIRLLGAEEYEIISELLNGQLEQMERCLDVSGIDYKQQEKFDPEALEKAMDAKPIDEVIDAVATDFNNKMKSLQVQVCRENGIEDQTIKSEFLQG